MATNGFPPMNRRSFLRGSTMLGVVAGLGSTGLDRLFVIGRVQADQRPADAP